MPCRFIVVDQNLRDYAGHHYDYSQSIVRAAIDRGMDVGIATHRDFRGATLSGAPVIGRFSKHWREAGQAPFRGLAKAALSRLPRSMRERLFAMIVPPPVAANDHAKPNSAFGNALIALIAGLGLQRDDHVLVHTVTTSEFLGVANGFSEHAPIAATWHIVLRYDGVAAMRHAFQVLDATNHRIRYWTDTEPLAAQYRELGCPRIGVLPIPHGLTDLPARIATPRRPLTLAYLGGARRDKGFHLLPDLVDRFVAEGTAPGQARFLIQATFGVSREEGVMDAALRRLRLHTRESVELIETPPDSESFQRALLATDILLLPYDPKVYRRRSSGLLVQAMALGIPTVVPEDTWLSSVAPEGGHVIFGDRATWIDAAREGVASIQSLELTASAKADAERRAHTPDALLALLMSPAMPDAAVPGPG